MARSIRRTRNRTGWRLERLEGRRLLSSSGLLVEGSAVGQPPEIRVLDADTGVERFRFAPFGPKSIGGVRVAVGDINGDGSLDLVAAAGSSRHPIVKIFRSTDGAPIGRFALPRAWIGRDLAIATGDVNGDGLADIVVSPGSGTARVRVYSGLDGRTVTSFRADIGANRGHWSGARIAVGDVNGDGFADIATMPVLGRSAVQVFSGRSFAAIADFRPFQGQAAGRTDIALADLNGDRRLEVVAAIPRGRSAALKAFNPSSGALLGRSTIAHAAVPAGLRINAVNLGGRGADELVIVPVHGRAGAAVLAASPWNFQSTDPIRPTVAYRLSAGSTGAWVSGANSVVLATPAVAVSGIEPPLSQNLPVLDRLAYYDPGSGKFVPVQANDPRLVGKDITVITHGWAPGYIDWVNHEATVNHRVLKWWETFPNQPGFDTDWAHAHPQEPASVFLLQGLTATTFFGSTIISTGGLAPTIRDRALLGTTGPQDSNAAVLAYSWIDDSATPNWDFLTMKIPEESYRSEALTTLNGERMAEALDQALGSSFNGRLQLVGHSHGSKVVSVASVAAQALGLPIRQVTTLDSPEDDVTVVGDAANDNWYFLQQLQNLDRSKPLGVFVDNAISEFGIPYSGISLSNGQGTNLSQIVDVRLYPDAYDSYDLGDRHSYAAGWYTGSGQSSVTFGQKVGQYWSPLLPANTGGSNPVPGLSSYSEQNWSEWSYPSSQQYVLNPQPGGAPTETITFKTLSNPSIALTQTGTMISSLPVSFSAPYYGQSGIAFDYQFANVKPGDRLIILADGKPAFVMDATLVGTGLAHATLSLYSLPFESHALTFVLTSETSNTTSSVTVANFQTFAQPLLI